MTRGWPALCVVCALFELPLYYFTGTMYNMRLTVMEQVIIEVVIFCSILSALILTALVTHALLGSQQAENDRRVLTVQVTALEQSAAAAEESERRALVLRHDLRHNLNILAGLPRDDRATELDEMLVGLNAALEQGTPERFCQNTLVNAALTPYVRRAREAGIAVALKLDVGLELPVPAGELAVVLANAMKNALHACAGLADATIELTVRADVHTLALALTNTCPASVRFGADGLPEATRSGHGMGTRSIAAFANQYGASPDFRQEGGKFIPQLLIQR